jgi:hypothetical protein
MPTLVRGLVFSAVLVGSLAEAADLRFSGHVAAIDPGGDTILVEELGAGKGTQPAVIQRSVSVGPETTFEVVQRSRDGGLPSVFKASPATQGDLKAGDFVTVTAQRRGNRLHAASVSIIRPDTAR